MAENNTNNPLISIVIPCYKCTNTVEDCVKSLVDSFMAAASKTSIELILIEDGSPDDRSTLEKCNYLAKQYCWDKITITVVQHPNNLGLSAVRNTGIAKANGKYVTFIDSDDTVKNSFFSTLIDEIGRDNTVDIFVWGLCENYINASDEITKSVQFMPDDGSYSSKKEIMQAAIHLEEKTLLGYAWNKLYRLDYLRENHLEFAEIKLVEDVMFNISAFDKAKKIRSIKSVLHNYQRRAENETSKSSSNNDTNASITNEFHNDYFDCFYLKIETLYNWYDTNDLLDDHVKKVLANEYSRYSFSAIWRNRNAKSGMTIDEQKQWIKDYYNLEMTKNLIEYINPEGKIAKKMGDAIQSRDVNKIYRIAGTIEFVTDHFTGLLNKLRQSR